MFAEEVASRHNKLLYYALALTKNRDKALDLVQDTILRALEYQASYKDNNLEGWLVTIMRNLFVGEMRKKRSFVELPELVETITPFNALAARQELAKLDNLPASSREVIISAAIGNTIEEIAEQFDIPDGTVKSRIHRARKQLQEM